MTFFQFYLFIYHFTVLYWFCHTLTWIHHGCTRVPPPEPPSHFPPHPIPLGHPSAPALSTLYHASNLDWWFVSHMIIYMFQCHSPILACSCPLPQSPKDCSIHLCLFCCLAYRVIITIFMCIFLNSTYIDLSANGHLGCLHVLATVNSKQYCKQSCNEQWDTCVSFNSGFLSVYAQQWYGWVIWQFYFQFFKESPYCSHSSCTCLHSHQ